jgi:hypothetical protein
MRPYLLLLSAAPLWAADDANQILKRFIQAQEANWEQARQYTYVEEAKEVNYDKKRQAVNPRSQTYEVMFVEGLEYKKLVARNGKPLEPREQAKEDKRLSQTAAERRKERHSGLTHRNVSLGSDQDLLTLFDNRVAGEDAIGGRKAWIIESVPKPDHAPAGQHEKEVMSFSRKMWIDETAYALLRKIETVVGSQIVFKPGTTISTEYEKINDDAWMQVSMVLDYSAQMVKFVKFSGKTEYLYSKFRKFDVQSTITADIPK